MPAKKVPTTSKKIAAKPVTSVVGKNPTIVGKPEKPPRGYEHRQFLVKKK